MITIAQPEHLLRWAKTLCSHRKPGLSEANPGSSEKKARFSVKQKNGLSKSAFERIYIILRMQKVSSRSVYSSLIHPIESNDSGSGHPRSLILAFAVRACTEGTFSLGAALIIYVFILYSCLISHLFSCTPNWYTPHIIVEVFVRLFLSQQQQCTQ